MGAVHGDAHRLASLPRSSCWLVRRTGVLAIASPLPAALGGRVPPRPTTTTAPTRSGVPCRTAQICRRSLGCPAISAGYHRRTLTLRSSTVPHRALSAARHGARPRAAATAEAGITKPMASVTSSKRRRDIPTLLERVPAADRPKRSRITVARDGGGGIRTHGPLSRTLVFKTSAIDHSATPPGPQKDSPEAQAPRCQTAVTSLKPRLGNSLPGPRPNAWSSALNVTSGGEDSSSSWRPGRVTR